MQVDDAFGVVRVHGLVMTKGVMAEVVNHESLKTIIFVKLLGNGIDQAAVVSSVRKF